MQFIYREKLPSEALLKADHRGYDLLSCKKKQNHLIPPINPDRVDGGIPPMEL